MVVAGSFPKFKTFNYFNNKFFKKFNTQNFKPVRFTGVFLLKSANLQHSPKLGVGW